MKNRFFVVVFAVLCLIVAAPSLAQVARGSGAVEADGNGRALAICTNECTVELSGTGVLAILSLDGSVEVTIDGTGIAEDRETEWGTAQVYAGFNGTATISGDFFAVSLRGVNITLDAEGTGRIHLRGNGTYVVNGETGEWSEEGESVPLITPDSD
ncbi:MAG: hypothetical protein AAF846_18105 [Chloroflexota bacterium]